MQAVTIEGPGNFSSPVFITVTVGGNKESDNSAVIGMLVATVAVIIIVLVAGLLITYIVR